MECNLIDRLLSAFRENDLKSENVSWEFDGPSSGDECPRSDTPSSDASTSGVCSMVSSDFEICGEEKQYEQEKELVIKYLNRDVLDLCGNLYPYELFQTTSVPKMNMSNYWDRRSIYHRLGPYGTLEEFEYEKCYDCDFHITIPKRKWTGQRICGRDHIIRLKADTDSSVDPLNPY